MFGKHSHCTSAGCGAFLEGYAYRVDAEDSNLVIEVQTLNIRRLRIVVHWLKPIFGRQVLTKNFLELYKIPKISNLVPNLSQWLVC